VLVIAVSACGGDDDVVTRPGAAGSPPQQQTADVEAAYHSYWDLVTRLEADGPTQDPQLTEMATGPALVDITAEVGLLKMADRLEVLGGSYKHKIVSVELGNDQATLRDCWVDDKTQVDRASHEPVPGEDGAAVTKLLAVTMVNRHDTWQLEAVETLHAFDGVKPQSCATG
jgi:hypothetical protein